MKPFLSGIPKSHLSNLAKFSNNIAIAFNDLLLNIESDLSPGFSIVFEISLVQETQSIPNIGISVRG